MVASRPEYKYKNLCVIHEGVSTFIYRGILEPDSTSVILKTLKAEYPTLEEITRLRHEYKILQPLNLQGVLKVLSLENSKNRLALVLEDFEGTSVYNLLGKQKISVLTFLSLACQLAETLHELHQNHIIHKDIKPHNILVNPQTEQIKLIDFGLATRLSKENSIISNLNLLEGTLAYMSPEQTGRMNRSLDYRTDFYSLGVTFYEMLTGQLPFPSNDPLELVHCHIAKTPVPPDQLNPEVPKAVSSIVMKLLAKTAEDRYQSAFGLKADLEKVLKKLQASELFEDFMPGRLDRLGSFIFPQKLYGRESEVTALMNAFERTRQGTSEMMLVAGYSGIGKTSVVNEVRKPIVAKRGYFIAGKFDQLKGDIPYAALIQAFQELTRQLLTESSEKIAVWKEKLSEALGPNGQVIIDVISEVKLIVGEQPEVPLLGPTEAQNRFNRVFKQFLSVFTKPEHPLVIFLDDLQWADLASLKLLELLVTDLDSQYLLLIGAYRDNEVTPTHPARLTVEKIEKAGATVNTILLPPLEIGSVTQLLADILSETEQSKELAELLCYKTQGNPFFLTQLFKTLYNDNLLIFDFAKGYWRWDIKPWDSKQIQTLGISDYNVVELVAINIRKLPSATQHVLKLAACIGNQFTLDVLALVSQETASNTAIKLWSALQEGLILPLRSDYKIPLEFEEGDWELETGKSYSQAPILYKFLHDRVQQAAYSLIPDDQKKINHLTIGKLLLKKTDKLAQDDNIFDIVNQLNIGMELITSKSEKEELANLNLIAGRKAKAATAYEAAVRYLTVGLGLLAENSWLSHYDLTLALHIEAVEAEYLSTNFERATSLAEVVLEQAKNLLDRVKAYELKIQFYIAQNQMHKAIEIGLSVVAMLGVSLSIPPSNGGTVPNFPRLEDLEDFPIMTDPYQLAALRILISLTPAAYMSNSPTFLPISLTQVNLCIEHGHSALATFSYGTYGVFLCGMRNLDAGYQSGQLSLRLLSQFNARELKAKIYGMFYANVSGWKDPIKETLAPLLEGIKSGLETGDLAWASYNTFYYCDHLLFSGESLELVAQKQAQYFESLLKLKQKMESNYLNIWRRMVLKLQGLAEERYSLHGEIVTDEAILQGLIIAKNHMSVFAAYLANAIIFYLFKDYKQAIAHARAASDYAGGVCGMMINGPHNFYYSLALLAQYPASTKTEREQALLQVTSNQEIMQQWAFHAPSNYQHKYDLVSAEKARVLGQVLEAMEYYDRAIQGAEEQGYIQEEALANELAAEFYLACGREKVATIYMTEAYYGYIHWGAIAKVKDLDKRYPQLISRTHRNKTTDINPTRTTNSSSRSSTALDFATVMKAAQALSSKIVLDELLRKLMIILIENAGAQTGCLILQRQGILAIEVSATGVEPQTVTVQQIPLCSEHLPLSVINYALRTGNNIVLDSATSDAHFARDPYIQLNKPQSVLCSPIFHQGKLTGILYLENNLATAAFTEERTEVLKLLTSQAAISLENALLYSNLEQANQQLEEYSHSLEVKVEERTQQLQEKNRQLEQTLLELRTAQKQMVAQEKLASLGTLTAGIAHEIRNPLNFVTSLASLCEGLTAELSNAIENQTESREAASTEAISEILSYLKRNVSEINQQGQRANSIIQSMLMHARPESRQRQKTDFNTLIIQSLQLAYHSWRDRDSSFNLALDINCDDSIGQLELFSSDFSRAIINIVDNACYAAIAKHKELGSSFIPMVYINTKNQGAAVEIRLRDNGTGITSEIREKIFNPFFTTKPTGQGTGLGLSLAHDIIVGQHRGRLEVQTEPGNYTEFIITLPKYLGTDNE